MMTRTMTMSRRRSGAGLVLLLLAVTPAAAQQNANVVTVTAGEQYAAGSLKRFVLGDNWRALWTAPVRVPVLDLATFAGGLTPEEQGGGNQSITLHMVDAAGREWIFRSIDKYPGPKLPIELRDAPAGAAIEDQVSALNPGGHFVLPRLLDAVGILHLVPKLYVMPDDPRLGEFRATFAGMLGEIEEIPNEGPDDTPGWGGSSKIKGSEAFLEDIEESADYRLEAREYAMARLVDFLVGDPDRPSDQWRWARYGEEGDYVYRPIPRDRDWAFVRADGALAKIARGFYPKLASFRARYQGIRTLTFSSYALDRPLLTELTRADFEELAAAAQHALTDEVITEAVRDLPPEYYALVGAQMTAALIARRDRLQDAALAYYRWLAEAVDVHATDERDLARVERHADGTVSVRIMRHTEATTSADDGAAANATPWFERRFVPDETDEVRVYLHGDADRALVTGVRDGPIVVRIIGGGGDDVLEDRTGAARLYDDRGDNEFVTVSGTAVRTKDWEDPEVPEGFRARGGWAPSFGSNASLFGMAFDYGEGAGLIVGVGPSYKRYGFRHLPYEARVHVRALYATRSGGFGIQLDGDYRFENSPLSLALNARATQFDAFRFYGFGNDTPELDPGTTLVIQDRVLIHPALRWQIGPRPGQPTEREEPAAAEQADAGAGEAAAEEEDEDVMQLVAGRVNALTGAFAIGPALQWSDADVPAGSPLAVVGAAAGVNSGYAGALATLELARTDRDAAPRRGYRARAEAAAYPLHRNAAGGFGSVGAELNGFVPLFAETHLAVRLGGERVFGDAPVFESAFVGGRASLRGFRSQRFAGDGSLFGGLELRMPLDTVEVIVNGELGVFALADAGRVWFGGSPGGWHTAVGGGAWFSVFDRAVSVAYAHGEEARFYAWWGLPF
jgi:hypothetical protein